MGGRDKDDTFQTLSPEGAAHALNGDRIEERLNKILADFEPSAIEYIVSAIVGEVEEQRVKCLEDIFGILQTFVPEEMLKQRVEDDDDMEVLLNKLWVALEKEGAIAEDEDEDDEVGGCEMCERDMPLTRHHLKPRSTHKKFLKQGLTQAELNMTASICRPCHSTVHRTHSNDMLGASYHTVERLMSDEKIRRFVVWAMTQKVTTREDARNPRIQYRR